ncbi:hypothetical protein A2671_00955 [Candidatus Kaiserbacteria bacterium RIFCSPHIGHO2_01_FULL_49_13]|uniref:HTH HARE-type domain-containing protein n=1 Tax=Candidatus Kaiserbacteria bacterium RIFCSPHIGHO2_01_FULL_49_13 TaxID=1798477 RepID=A0A1F6CFW9_9BACT|nr:MAG: hypothetical protein A2671_00955 [Candidatus Kaiserbacteria bacterium RIFCSPHIGHO2_01_FULL_49_13]
MPTISSVKPKQVVKELLKALQPRVRDVVISRYGLGPKAEKMTLESIGEKYGITRERVRQIENYALNAIRKSPAFTKTKPAFDELTHMVDEFGGLVPEEAFLAESAGDLSTRNHIHFMLVLGDTFTKHKEDEEFYHRWNIDPVLAERVHKALSNLCSCLSETDVMTEAEIIETFLKELKDVSQKYKNETIIKRWLSLSKGIDKNPLGEWGAASSPNVRVKGIRDYAYLVIKRHGSPMHFTEVAKTITKLFGKKAHVATTHNELIKDQRFVLVGRGLYALKEWGYTTGVVKDVIKEVLKKNGPLTRDEIITKVRNERYVKDNTILVNLQDSSLFKRGADGRYALA